MRRAARGDLSGNRPGPAAGPDPQAGLTLIEVLVALLVLTVVMTSVMTALLANTRVNTRVVERAEAIRVSEEVLEGYRQVGSYGQLAAQGAEAREVLRAGRSYRVQTTFCPADRPPEMQCSESAVFIRLSVGLDGRELHRAETYYTAFGKVTP